MTITMKKQNNNGSRRKTEYEEWDTTASAMSFASKYTLRSYSSKSSEYLKHIGSISLYSDTEKNDSPSVTFHKEQPCNCRNLLGLINRNNSQYSNKAQLQNNNPMKPMSTIINNNCKESTENDNSAEKKNILSINATQLREKNYNFDKVNNVKNSNYIFSLPKLSESNT
ncbi:Retinoblastoma-like protein [Dirofilaria immitis]